jgi:hypothetical protein
MSRRSTLAVRGISAAALFGVTLAIGGSLARPVSTASIGFDSQVAVVDFSRLLAGRHVTDFLSTTPKPLLTFIFGPLELLTHDWRTLAWATLLAFGLGVVLAAELARRIGGTQAWAFVGVGLAGSGALLFDVGYSLAIPWALVGWSVAGLAVSRPQPRYGLAGVALLLATLARLETLLIVGLVAVVLAAIELPFIARALARHAIGRPPRRAWLILVGFGALLVMGLHDLLIYGDPVFWSTVAARYSAGVPDQVLGPLRVIRLILGHYLEIWPLVVLGLVGIGKLIRDRAWALLAGLVAMGPGMAVFLLFLAFRRIVVPDRYLAPIDLAGIVAAGIGTAWLVGLGLARLEQALGVAGDRARPLTAGAIGASIVLAVVVIWPSGILDVGLQSAVDQSLALAADLDHMTPTLRAIVDRTPGAQAGSMASGPPRLLLAPRPYQPRLSLDLGVPGMILGDVSPWASSAGGHPLAGQFVAHDRHADGSGAGFQPYETVVAITLDGVRVVPIASDPAQGWWITQIDRVPPG